MKLLNSNVYQARDARPSRALLGSVDYIASSFKTSSESDDVRQAANASSYGNELVQAALSVNNKVNSFSYLTDRLSRRLTHHHFISYHRDRRNAPHHPFLVTKYIWGSRLILY